MSVSRVIPGVAAATLLTLAGCAAATVARTTTSPARVQVVATGLDQPKKVTLGPDGSLIVTLSGDGKAESSCTGGDQRSCVDASGAVDEITASGRITRLASGLGSVSGGSDEQATGPVEARLIDGTLHVLFQDELIDAKTGAETFGAAGKWLGDLVAVRAGGGTGRIEADLGAYEAAHEPDHGRGSGVTYDWESAINSDPYGFLAYRGGYVVTDAGGNDLLFISRTGHISVLAVFPTIREYAAAGTFGSKQTKAIIAQAQAVPDSIAVGPGGALYVGELGGAPFGVGTSVVYRIVPGHRATVYARGFTAIGDIAFDREGRLLVLELDTKGLNDPGLDGTGTAASGAIIRVAGDGRKTTIASAGLDFPTGMVVAADGDIYVANRGSSDADGTRGGELVEVVPQ